MSKKVRKWNEWGFTLIEITLVIVVMGILAAVIVPRAMRAREDAKFSLVRQAGAELAQWGVTWAERALLARAGTGSATLVDYAESLYGWTGDQSSANNWTGSKKSVDSINPPNTVSDLIAGPALKNPFNGASYFDSSNGDGNTEGQLKLCRSPIGTLSSGTSYEYYFLFTGFSPPNWYGTTTTVEDSGEAMGNRIFMGEFRKN